MSRLGCLGRFGSPSQSIGKNAGGSWIDDDEDDDDDDGGDDDGDDGSGSIPRRVHFLRQRWEEIV